MKCANFGFHMAIFLHLMIYIRSLLKSTHSQKMEIFTDMGVTDLDSAENFDLNQVKIVGCLFF